MDILCHAMAGAATGALYGRPVLGAMVAAAPDAVLGIRRKPLPTVPYNATHSLLFALLCGLVAGQFSWDIGWVVFLSLVSHLVLDLPTHGPVWAPTLWFPFSKYQVSDGSEWEFFNRAWWRGLAVTALWSAICLIPVFLSDTGSPLSRSVQ